jgi:hypothetical protein
MNIEIDDNYWKMLSSMSADDQLQGLASLLDQLDVGLRSGSMTELEVSTVLADAWCCKGIIDRSANLTMAICYARDVRSEHSLLVARAELPNILSMIRSELSLAFN